MPIMFNVAAMLTASIAPGVARFCSQAAPLGS
jgi:hypothetical protein